MKSLKRVALVATLLVFAGGIYFWGHSDGRSGNVMGFLGTTLLERHSHPRPSQRCHR
jgi:hypothetical protein